MFFLAVCGGFAQVNPVEDFKPSETNQPGREYPKVNSEGRVRASISAPEAQKVQLDIGGVKYDMAKNTDGVWRRSLYEYAQLLFKK